MEVENEDSQLVPEPTSQAHSTSVGVGTEIVLWPPQVWPGVCLPELTQKCPWVSYKLMFLKLKPDINLSEGGTYLNPRKMELHWDAASKSAEAFN